jgi:dolichol-phosphate mannosyltransferase
MKPNVLIITPAYQEWNNLLELLPRVVEQLSKFDVQSKWLIICENSITNSAAYEDLKVTENVEVCRRELGNESFAAALQVGINQIDLHEYVVFMDGDQSHQPEQIGKLVDVLCDHDEIDIAISSRYIDGGSSENSLMLKTMSKVLNIVFRKFLKLDAKDISTNFKAFRAPLLRNVELVSKNFEAVEELLIHCAVRLGQAPNIQEIPDTFTTRVYGESKRKLGQFIGTYLMSLLFLKRKIRNQATKNL